MLDGPSLGAELGSVLGMMLGGALGTELGSALGLMLGGALGDEVGSELGLLLLLGVVVGELVGRYEGAAVAAAYTFQLGAIVSSW